MSNAFRKRNRCAAVLCASCPVGDRRSADSSQEKPIGPAYDFLRAIWAASGGEDRLHSDVAFTGERDLPSLFAVSDLAVASIGAAALAVAEPPALSIDTARFVLVRDDDQA